MAEFVLDTHVAATLELPERFTIQLDVSDDQADSAVAAMGLLEIRGQPTGIRHAYERR